MNEMFSQRTYRILRAFLTAWLRILHPVIHVHGRENIPEGPCMLCCNHSCFSDLLCSGYRKGCLYWFPWLK